MTQMIAQHTPGPWTLNVKGRPPLGQSAGQFGSKFQETEIVGADGHIIADLRWNGRNETHGDSNARLIAAAPDLLAALEVVAAKYQEMFSVMPVAWQTVDDIVSAAIAKARGA